MRMSADEFFADAVGNIGHVEGLFFTAELGVKRNVQKQVPQLIFDFLEIACKNSIAQFIGLFDGEVAQRLKSLFAVPRALFA